ncbi:MAG: hypothetical protein AB1434_12365 [Pseudomonadota bacterium]
MPRLLPLRPTSAVLVAALIAFGGALTPAPASAADDGATATVQPGQPKARHKAKKAAKLHAPRQRVKFDKGSGETAAERDRRLRRECKGRPNAGACLGYAS